MHTSTAATSIEESGSAWTPLRSKAFAILWTATVLSHIGTWMHDVAAGWLMTTLSSSALMVSLVQAATTLPIFLLALPAGALADIVDRRKLLLGVNVYMALLALCLGAFVLGGNVNAFGLLAITFLLGIGTALIGPAWQAIVPSLVGREQLSSAVALNSLGINISRAIGPAVGAALIAGAGLAWPFLANALSFLCVIGALTWWRPPRVVTASLPAEHFTHAMRAGLQYAWSSPPLRATFIRALAFFSCASAYWALLPLIARERLNGDARLYGVLVTMIGIGAVSGALVLPRLRAIWGPTRTAAVGAGATSVALAMFAVASNVPLAVIASVLSGAAWILVLSSLNVSAQASLAEWVRARGLAVYSAIFFGAMSLGSVLWGYLADSFGMSTALGGAAGLSVIVLLATARYRLQAVGELDLRTVNEWPQIPLGSEWLTRRGPVLVSIEYRVDASNMKEFVDALHALAAARRRNGVYRWGAYQDSASPERVIEQFFEHSWLDHGRHHERMTRADRELQHRVQAFHAGDSPPIVTHYIVAADHSQMT